MRDSNKRRRHNTERIFRLSGKEDIAGSTMALTEGITAIALTATITTMATREGIEEMSEPLIKACQFFKTNTKAA